jgi:sulfur carrier protein
LYPKKLGGSSVEPWLREFHAAGEPEVSETACSTSRAPPAFADKMALRMKIQINGGDRDCPELLSLEALLTQLGMKADRVAVELNRTIVPREEWSRTALKEGDRLEIVHFVGGGTLR